MTSLNTGMDSIWSGALMLIGRSCEQSCCRPVCLGDDPRASPRRLSYSHSATEIYVPGCTRSLRCRLGRVRPSPFLRGVSGRTLVTSSLAQMRTAGEKCRTGQVASRKILHRGFPNSTHSVTNQAVLVSLSQLQQGCQHSPRWLVHPETLSQVC